MSLSAARQQGHISRENLGYVYSGIDDADDDDDPRQASHRVCQL
jgi:hypothetical protein